MRQWREVAMSTVVGRAIGVRREANPGNEAVEAKLQEFIDAMEAGPHAVSCCLIL
jgi:hypothetical protein